MSDVLPDDPTAIPVAESVERAAGLRCFYAYRFVFENPKWLTNVLCCTLCSLIPIIGPLVLLGYEYEIVEMLHRRSSRTYPDFDFGRFTDYLTRGVWPFLLQIILSFVLVPAFMVVAYGPILICLAIGGIVQSSGGDPAWMILCIAVGVAVSLFAVIGFSIVVGMFVMPLMLRGGLAQDFAEMFKPAFAWDFVRRVWKEMLLAILFLIGSSIVLVLAGYAMCVIGLLLTMPLVTLARAHIVFQLYELYLNCGGTPIPLKVSKPPVKMRPSPV